ncbi:MAG: hypothetical protein ACOCVJ_00180 [Verrucomicrobiota bacterium]
MDNLLEIIIPLVFAAIYFLGNFFAKKEDADELSSPQQRRERNQSEDADAAERQRRIQEEIRRKIMERRQASGGDDRPSAAPSPVVGPSPEELRRRREEVEARQRMRERQKETSERERGSEAVAEAATEVEPTKKPIKQSEVGGFSWDDSDNVYKDGIDDRLKQIEATQRQANALKKKAIGQLGSATRPDQTSVRRRGSVLSGSVREELTSPAAARAAFVYGEVLGKPVGLRKGESQVPGLS